MRAALALSRLAALALASFALACSDDGGDGPAAGTSGSAGTSAAGAGGTGGNAGTGGAAGSAGTGGGSAGAGTGGAADASIPDDAGMSDAGGFTEVGVCGRRGEGMVDTTSFEATEEFYILSEAGFGDEICVVRFDVKRVGDAPPGCDDPTANIDCLWTHLVEYSNPTVVLDENGVCANSELALDQAAIDAIDGSRAAYGFVSEFAGHASVILTYDESLGDWDGFSSGTWDQTTSAFRFDRRDGVCEYR